MVMTGGVGGQRSRQWGKKGGGGRRVLGRRARAAVRGEGGQEERHTGRRRRELRRPRGGPSVQNAVARRAAGRCQMGGDDARGGGDGPPPVPPPPAHPASPRNDASPADAPLRPLGHRSASARALPPKRRAAGVRGRRHAGGGAARRGRRAAAPHIRLRGGTGQDSSAATGICAAAVHRPHRIGGGTSPERGSGLGRATARDTPRRARVGPSAAGGVGRHPPNPNPTGVYRCCIYARMLHSTVPSSDPTRTGTCPISFAREERWDCIYEGG